MASLGVVLILGCIACACAAPDSKPTLDDSATALTSSNEENDTDTVDAVVDDIMKKITSNDIDGAEKSFKDFVEKATEAESRVSDPTATDDDSDEDAEGKEIGNVFKQVLKKIAKDGKESEKKIRDILEIAAKTGQLDRGFVSDLINSTLGGVHMGISLGNNNGTSNQLCIKLGNIVMTGCRRSAVAKDTSNDPNSTPTSLERKARMARKPTIRKHSHHSYSTRNNNKKITKNVVRVFSHIIDELERSRQEQEERRRLEQEYWESTHRDY
ncbi:uncharacterized protein LOC115442457 [Manduca sexta]|uniref:uncharacterized protein LOC115442457 n=1 Tax=Manduca sexta TaxID=7130 RepID=UPI00188E0CE5|nr:uncharacterized protein LOC115442457 [Manduca sexta]